MPQRFLPTLPQQQAVKARLNMLLGAQDYDLHFLQFEFGEIADKVARVHVGHRRCAGAIEAHYAVHVAIAIESVMKKPVKRVEVLLTGSPAT